MVKPEVKKKLRQRAEASVKSRKEIKKLEKIVLRKRTKLDRSQILAELKKVQLGPGQLELLHSTSSMQTKGLKRFAFDNGRDQSKNFRSGASIKLAESLLDASLLIKRKRCKLRARSDDCNTKSSSSEDTEDMSTDTEIYYDNEDVVGSQVGHRNLEDSKEKNEQTQDVKQVEPNNEIDSQITAISEKCLELIKVSQPAVYVPVNRNPSVENSRLKLPIMGEEQRIVEKIRYNDIVIISGETGSGKTTQIPQFLYEAGYTLNNRMIGITEPRRVAAVAMSERVAHELNLTSNEVAYQIRFAGTVSEKTQIKFMTDGVLLRECQQDFLLSKYSVLIIDEAHERSVFSDILIGLLSRIVPLRTKKGDPLKLVIMSATLRVKDFTENAFLFPKVPPLIKIETRQYPVTVQFVKKTPTNHLLASYKKVCAIHAKMPRGGILVFVTSQMDVKALCKKLQKKSMLFCLGLYAMLPIDKQRQVFNEPPEGYRLCVIATNVAETSITIPNIKYVVDTGLEKKKIYDPLTGVSRFITTWTSKSSAEQRMGRAGRMGSGFCYRLYSSAVYTNDLPDHADPQILQKPVEDVLLQMKTMHIDNVVNFPFPTRPSLDSLKAAEKKLVLLGALDDTMIKMARYGELKKTEYTSRPTALGKAMSKFAVSARCSKMIVLSPHELVIPVITLVSALTVREMFLSGNQYRELWKKWVGQGSSKQLGDFMLMIRAVSFALSVGCSDKQCLENGLRTKAMLEIDKLRRQLTNEINHESDRFIGEVTKDPKRLGEPQSKILRQLLLSSFCDHVARKLPDGIVNDVQNISSKKDKKKLKHAYECMEIGEPVYIGPESVLKGEHPEYVIYKELYKGEKKMFMRDIAVVEPSWFPYYAEKLCNFHEPDATTATKQARYDKLTDQIVCSRQTSYGTLNWNLGVIDIPMELVDTGSDIYKHFAFFLLSGEIFDWFKKYVNKLLSPPSIMTKPWSKLQPRTSKILKLLVTTDVKSKKKLSSVWENDPSFLKREYLAWLPEILHSRISQDWDESLAS